jgi:hypothetical protein
MKRILMTALFALSSAMAFSPDYQAVLTSSDAVIESARTIIEDDDTTMTCGTPSMIYTVPNDTTITKERSLAQAQGLEYLGAMEIGDDQFIMFNWTHPRAIAFAAWVDLGNDREVFWTRKCLITRRT